jgi:hypothetical protein
MQNGNKGSLNYKAPESSDLGDNRGVQQECFRTGVSEPSKQDVQRVTKDQELDLVDEWTPSKKKKKKTAHREGAGNVETPGPTTTGRSDRSLSSAAWGECIYGGSGGSGWHCGEKENPKPQEDVTSRALRRKGTVIHC